MARGSGVAQAVVNSAWGALELFFFFALDAHDEDWVLVLVSSLESIFLLFKIILVIGF
jgi:hypothetical protein